LDGADVLALIRTTSDVPVVIATARDDEREIVRLLDAGADDYLIKPFSARRPAAGAAAPLIKPFSAGQAMARIRAVLRRTTPTASADPRVIVGGLVVDPVSRTPCEYGQEHALNTPDL